MDSCLVRVLGVCFVAAAVVMAMAHPYPALCIALVIGALFAWIWRRNRQHSQARRQRSEDAAAALDGDASGAVEATGWCCVGRGENGGDALWTVRWRTMHPREGMDISPGGQGIHMGGRAPAVLVPTNRLLDEVQVEVPCAVAGEIVWSARNEPLAADQDLAEVRVDVDASGMTVASTDGLAVGSIGVGGEVAKAEALAQLKKWEAAVGRSVRAGDAAFDAQVRSRAGDETLLARLTRAEEVRQRIAALTAFNGPFDATVRLREGALTWTSVVTSRTDASGLRSVVPGLVALARGLEAA